MSLEMSELKKKIFKIDRRHSVVNKSCNKIRMATHSKISHKVILRRKRNSLRELENRNRISKLGRTSQDHFENKSWNALITVNPCNKLYLNT